MRKLMLIFLIFNFQFLISTAQTPYWNWAKHAGGTNYDEATVIITNNNNNLTVTGFFRGTSWFPTDTFTAGLSNAMFIAEYDMDGNMLWVKHVADASGAIFPEYLFQDATGNFYVVGTFGAYSFGGTVTFFPSTTFASAGHSDIFIAKFDESANLLWAQAIHSAESPAAAYTAALDDANNLFVAGTLFGQHIFTSTVNDTIFSDSNWHIYLAKYTSTGILAGTSNIIESTQVMYPYGMITDPAHNIFIAGKYLGKPIFGIEPDTFSIAESPFYDALFISRFSSVGPAAVWAYPGISSTSHYPFTLDTDEAYNLIISGAYSTSVMLTSASSSATLTSASDNEIFLASYNRAGALLWAKNGGHSSSGAITITDAVHNQGANIFLTGNYTGSPTFGEGSATAYIPYMNDLFVAMYDETGTLDYVQHAGGASGENSYSITLDEFNNPYIAGHFNLASVFDSTATLQITLSSYGYTDILVAKLGDNIFVSQDEFFSAKNDLNFFPNPANNEITVEIQYVNPKIRLDIYNSMGQMVFQSNIINQTTTINLESFSKGLYFFKVCMEDEVVVKKIIIE